MVLAWPQTFVVGEVDEQGKKLIKTAHDCLAKAIAMCKPGVRYRDVGEVITKHAQANGYVLYTRLQIITDVLCRSGVVARNLRVASWLASGFR
eukprot:1142477-Pelagomonas_calceolata.AAC.4